MSSNRGVSNFAAAAKVLFDSAAKVGAVEPLSLSGKRYAQQLKKIQNQSRKRGGSLGGVSYKVAEFLATQRNPPENLQKCNIISIAKRVPLIDIPLKSPTNVPLSKPEEKRKPPELNVLINNKKDKIESDPPKVSEVASRSTFCVPNLNFIGKTSVSVEPSLEPSPKMADGEDILKKPLPFAEVGKINVAEVEPIFESPIHTEAKPSGLTEHIIPSVPHVVPFTLTQPTRLVSTVPISSTLISMTTETIEATQNETISVDVWELQREREIQQVRKNQEESERERLAIQREEEHKTLGDEWVRQRTVTSQADNLVRSGVGFKILEKLYFTSQWESSFQCFKDLMGATTLSTSTYTQAVRLMENRLKDIPLKQRDAVRIALKKKLSERKLQDEVIKVNLRELSGAAFLEAYRASPSSVRENLNLNLVSKVVSTLMGEGLWEEALELVDRSQQRFIDKSGFLEMRLLKSANALSDDAKKNVIDHVTKTLSAGSRLGKEHKILLAKLHKGSTKRSMLAQLISSNDADETVYAEILRITSNDKVKDLMDEIKKRGLNPEDPVILGALCWKVFDPENPQVLFREIARQEVKIGIRPVHLQVAIAMAKTSKTEDALKSTMSIIKKCPLVHAKLTLRRMLPLLHEKNMTKEIVELVDLYAYRVPLEKALPDAIAFINNAFQIEGREPLTSHSVSELVKESKQSPQKVSSSTSRKTTEVVISSEQMLQYAKEKNWVKALEALKLVTESSIEDAETLTLFYNCALSASVDKVDIAKSLFTTMTESGAKINATTNNAILSALMRSSKPEEVVEFYKDTVPSARDMNTYSLMLSFLGKTGMWKEAVDVFQKAHIGSPKIPTTVYALAIGAVHSHSWSDTLKVFQEMLKEHGAQNINDVVLHKVTRCLTQNKRTSELQKLETEMTKKKKKKQE